MKTALTNSLMSAALISSLVVAHGTALAQVAFTKAQVGKRIRKVEDGVDEFRQWAENRGEHGKTQLQAARNSGRGRGRTATESQKAQAANTKDDLEGALSDLNRSTNRLRRKFNPADKWMETRPQVERVLDDGRRINQVLVRGHYGTRRNATGVSSARTSTTWRVATV